jgi:hypothetical protein
MPTAQAIFDEVVCHLRTQGKPSVDESGLFGRLRGCDGRKCPVGFYILDKEYGDWMEGAGVEDLLGQDLPVRIRLLLTRHQDLLTDLQVAHDSAINESDDQLNQYWETKFGKIAVKHNLIYVEKKNG